ncbi:NAD(P)/FAD-dependent oxidoreductase [Thiomicrorhabdus sp. 6S3-12]|uniref:NAD(P)/FAD-dependent oxidoreductase n=1 Tax=Thiomicrorhabdus sp. 6S3-12 TaxID=2819681 RepID=UPI001AAC4A95|nr:FAD/NAD(P)-binding oxidoreductase [Thiomicrorhabdus sp. 6S3-12]MBO1924111.1 NAD(P)/FAD-dependent oxidoreductase [Thiomicrorhabdus sp. 6S3-12]
MSADNRKLTVLGSGFAALTAIKQLRKLNPNAEITVISPSKEFIYLPSLIWIPSGMRSGDDLRIDLTNFFSKNNIQHVKASVTNVTNGGRTVETDAGEFDNDGLLIASGGRFIKKLPGIEHAITPCEGIPAAEKIRDRLNAMDGGTIAIGFGGNPNEPSAMRGGPMFEFLFGIDNLLRQQGRRDKFKLIFFNPAAQPGKRLGDKVPANITKMMAKKGIETKLGHKMKGFEANLVKTEGEEFAADLILFMPGMTGPAWLPNSELPKSAGGMITANQFAQVEGYQATYVAGDAGSFPGPDWQAKQAHAADLQATAAAQNLTKELNGQTDYQAFKHELICIVDTLKHGILIKRTEKGTTLLPPCRLFHWAKRIFEGLYLRQYR